MGLSRWLDWKFYGAYAGQWMKPWMRRKKTRESESSPHAPSNSKKDYKNVLRKLQVELVKLQRHFIKCDDKILIILEGRDASGKDGAIKRSWYNCAGVERVMSFCTEAEHEEFMGSVSEFENMLVRSGVKLLKYCLDIGKTGQKRRLEDRKSDPLKQRKVSPIDNQAVKYWKAYSAARNEMLARANDKRLIRLDPQIVFPYDVSNLENGQLAK